MKTIFIWKFKNSSPFWYRQVCTTLLISMIVRSNKLFREAEGSPIDLLQGAEKLHHTAP